MQLTGAEIIVECLKEQGVDTVFGYPGGAILNIYDALYQHQNEITHILTSHEQGASHAADGYARATGKVGVTRRDPMAMLPFCGYNMSNYFSHWISMGKKLGNKAPKIFNVNWFRTDENGNFIWPGFGDNLRVIEWILKRCENEVPANDSKIGYLPFPSDINISGLSLSKETLEGLIEIDDELWKDEIVQIEELYSKFEGNLPSELLEELKNLKDRF